jgi:hypothetical protein
MEVVVLAVSFAALASPPPATLTTLVTEVGAFVATATCKVRGG